MSDDQRPIHLTPQGPPSTELPPPDPTAHHALEQALAGPAEARREAISAVVAMWPRYVDAWARLGDLGRDDIERYAAYRVGTTVGSTHCGPVAGAAPGTFAGHTPTTVASCVR